MFCRVTELHGAERRPVKLNLAKSPCSFSGYATGRLACPAGSLCLKRASGVSPVQVISLIARMAVSVMHVRRSRCDVYADSY